jgi:hypothetical protein
VLNVVKLKKQLNILDRYALQNEIYMCCNIKGIFTYVHCFFVFQSLMYNLPGGMTQIKWTFHWWFCTEVDSYTSDSQHTSFMFV